MKFYARFLYWQFRFGLRWLRCHIPGRNNYLYHRYTSVAEMYDFIGAPQVYVDEGLAGFWKYSARYCKDCGYVYPESAKLIREAECQQS